jgi:hypothetical protein
MKKWGLASASAVGAAVVAGVLGFALFRPSEEDRIRRVLDRLGKAVMVKADDNILVRTGRVRSELKETVTDDVYVDVADLNVRVTNRVALAERATQAGLAFQTADYTLVGTVIKVDESATTAKVDAVAIVTASRGGERKVDQRPVHFLLRNDGQWRVTTIDVAPSQRQE